MDSSESTWNSLEIVKLLVGIATPITIGVLGWFIQKRLKQVEQELSQTLWTKQTVIEKRLERFDAMGPLLNDLYCYYRWIGRWKETSPMDVIAKKRELDRHMYVYQFLFSEELFIAYQAFMGACFDLGTHVGEDARLRTAIISTDGDNRRDAYEASPPKKNEPPRKWDPTWNKRFVYEQEPDPVVVGGNDLRWPVRTYYDNLMAQFSAQVGLGDIRAPTGRMEG